MLIFGQCLWLIDIFKNKDVSEVETSPIMFTDWFYTIQFVASPLLDRLGRLHWMGLSMG